MRITPCSTLNSTFHALLKKKKMLFIKAKVIKLEIKSVILYQPQSFIQI